MGITGLIPFLEKASSKVNIKDLKGSTIAVDTYCWLHKGAFACADKLGRGEETDIHIQYCLKYVNLFLSYDIKPILVFDGKHLPAKAQTEARRREIREASKKRAAELLRMGRSEEALSHLRRCVDITHEMALELIKACRKRNVDCIVAPYEADAQLAYLNKQNIAQYIVTEDSDLVLFGCKNIIFKLDLMGNGLLVQSTKLALAMGCHPEKFTFDKFRAMCILSGCDYLDSLPGIGLAKACKFMLKTEETDMRKLLPKLPSYLNMRSLEVPMDYIENFLKADATFKHMYVFDPIKRKMLRLNDLSEFNTNPDFCCNAGINFDEDLAFQMALGNINPFSLKCLDNWHPDFFTDEPKGGKTSSWNQTTIAKHRSIWQPNFKPHKPNSKSGDIRVAFQFSKPLTKNKINLSFEEDVVDAGPTEDEIISIYSSGMPPTKRRCLSSDPPASDILIDFNNTANNESHKTPTKNRHNPFLKTTPETIDSPTKLRNTSLIKNVSPVKKIDFSKNSGLQKLSKFNRTIINDKKRVISRFFNCDKLPSSKNSESSTSSSQESQESNNDNDQNKILGDIVADLQSQEEKQNAEAIALYLSSPEATLSDRGDRTPPRCTSTSVTDSFHYNNSAEHCKLSFKGNQNLDAIGVNLLSATTLDRGDKTPIRFQNSTSAGSLDGTMTAPNFTGSDSGFGSVDDNPSMMALNNFKYKSANIDLNERHSLNHNAKLQSSEKDSPKDDIIILSDDDGSNSTSSTIKGTRLQSKPTVRRLGLAKTRKTAKGKQPINQSRLSMFGFQKRPSLTLQSEKSDKNFK